MRRRGACPREAARIAGMAFPGTTDIEAIIAGLMRDYDAVCEGVAVTKAGAKSTVRIVVDSANPRGERLGLDAIEQLSVDIGAALDAAEEAGNINLGVAYTLDVGTPGVDMPLTLPRHWERNIGRLVVLPESSPFGAAAARVAQVTETGVVLLANEGPQGKKKGKANKSHKVSKNRGAVDGSGQQVLPEISCQEFAAIAGAVVEVEFNPMPASDRALIGLPLDAYNLPAANDAENAD